MSEYKVTTRVRVRLPTQGDATSQPENSTAKPVKESEKSTLAKKKTHERGWSFAGVVVGACAAIAAAVVGAWLTIAGTRHDDALKAESAYRQQIEIEISIASRIKQELNEMPDNLGPSAHASSEEIRRRAQEYRTTMLQAAQIESQHELTQNQDTFLGDVYLSRHQLFDRINRTFVGAVVQADYQSSAAYDPKRPDTLAWVASTLNATMSYNSYVDAISAAARSHHVAIPNNLWMIHRGFTGPMMDDGL